MVCMRLHSSTSPSACMRTAGDRPLHVAGSRPRPVPRSSISKALGSKPGPSSSPLSRCAAVAVEAAPHTLSTLCWWQHAGLEAASQVYLGQHAWLTAVKRARLWLSSIQELQALEPAPSCLLLGDEGLFRSIWRLAWNGLSCTYHLHR